MLLNHMNQMNEMSSANHSPVYPMSQDGNKNFNETTINRTAQFLPGIPSDKNIQSQPNDMYYQ